MSGSVNKVIIVGNLGADPQVRRLASGDPVATLRIATSESWRDRNSGERKEKTEWHQVVIFNDNLAKVAEQYLKKGMKVFLEGALQTRKWQHSDGSDRYCTEIILQKFRGSLQLLDKRDDGDDRSASSDRGFDQQSSKAGSGKTKDRSYGAQSKGEDEGGNRFGEDFNNRNFDNELDDEIPF